MYGKNASTSPLRTDTKYVVMIAIAITSPTDKGKMPIPVQNITSSLSWLGVQHKKIFNFKIELQYCQSGNWSVINTAILIYACMYGNQLMFFSVFFKKA